MARKYRMDQALRTRQRGIRIATAVILLLGAGVIVWALASPERRRTRIVDRLAIGLEASNVAQLLGPAPATCAVGSLDHLRRSFPVGSPPATVEGTIGRMQDETAQRWVYPLDARDPGGPSACTRRSNATEIGLDREQRVLWYVAITGRTSLELPPDFVALLPAESADTPADTIDS
jgi:hypothetical protein